MQIELSNEELETLKNIYQDWGSDCPGTDYDKYKNLGIKLGWREPDFELTEEELKRREEFRNSSLGKLTSDLFKQANKKYIEMMKNWKQDAEFMKETQQSVKIGSSLKIRLPYDYYVNKVLDFIKETG